MARPHKLFLCWFLPVVACALTGHAAEAPLAQRPWVEVSTAHFNFYSCGPLGNVYKLAARLEQFSRAYAQLAGAPAVASPPIVVMVFPDRQTLEPFLPLYHGQPASILAFFHHGPGENLIVLSLPEPGSGLNLDVIFHEYAHFLFRRNDGVWPLWLKEGMAEMYSTFETSGRCAQIGAPIPHHLRLLTGQPLMPLAELFSVKEDSPAYNEQERQGMFYAESWLLTHFLMAGDIPGYVSRFGQFTALLRQGQLPADAFANALQTSLLAMQAQLQRYLLRGQFRSIHLVVATNLSAPIASKVRSVAPAEVCFRLGDELLRSGQARGCGTAFCKARELAPASPLPEEGLGLLAARRGQTDAALQHLSGRHGPRLRELPGLLRFTRRINITPRPMPKGGRRGWPAPQPGKSVRPCSAPLRSCRTLRPRTSCWASLKWSKGMIWRRRPAAPVRHPIGTRKSILPVRFGAMGYSPTKSCGRATNPANVVAPERSRRTSCGRPEAVGGNQQPVAARLRPARAHRLRLRAASPSGDSPASLAGTCVNCCGKL